ncbi:hypothetical protein BGX21_009448 [Mortierella sp. AD011]|nr:hypothetical protein BGX21_009448 [Mortierella sp. AD011]
MAPPSSSGISPAASSPNSPALRMDTAINNPNTSTASSVPSSSQEQSSTIPFADRILAAEHRFTSLTQNITHFSPLKTQLDKHNVAIERLESEIKKKTALLQSYQDKLQVKSLSKRPQTSRQGSNVSLHNTSEDSEADTLQAQQRETKESLESLNGQLLAAKILRMRTAFSVHIGLTRQVAQYFESRSELHTLLDEIFAGSTPEHPSEDALEQELEQITTDIQKVKEDFEKHRSAKNEFKEAKRYIDFWNDAVEKQVASTSKDVTKSFKKFVPFLGPKPPSYIKIADAHLVNARAFVPSLEEVGLLSEVKLDTITNTSNDLIIFTAKFKDSYSSLSLALETLLKKHKALKKTKVQCMEKLFDERCRIFSEELQKHYRSIGESLVGSGNGSDSLTFVGDDISAMDAGASSNGHRNSGLRLPIHRQHVESHLGTYSAEGSTLGHNSQELLLDAEEPPSYFQHEQHEAIGVSSLHRRNLSLGSPARSSTASSSLSLHSPIQAPFAMTDSPPDYVRDEHLSAGTIVGARVRSWSGTSGSGVIIANSAGADDNDDDAQFRAYHQRYDTRQRQNSDPRATRTNTTSTTVVVDMPPGYEEARCHNVVDPV